MNRRLEQFLVAENLTQSVFASTIGVANGSVSHIISGRNKPGFDFIERTARHFPNLNIEWLITGRGRMYKNQDARAFREGLFDETPESSDRSSDTLSDSPSETMQPVAEPETKETDAEKEASDSPAPEGKISRIVVFFDNGTFRELK